MNNTTDKDQNTGHLLDYLIPPVFLFVLLLFVIFYLLKSGLLRRHLARLGLTELSSAREPLLDSERGWMVAWWKDRIELLVKRCDQVSTYEIEEHIIDRLKQKSRVKSWDRAKDDGQQPVIVFCVISSRIGTDIENAMRGVHGNSRVVLVLLHCVLKDLLRGDLSDDEELLDSTMINRMEGIVHFAFSDREGLYTCRQNTFGFEKLVNTVNSLD